MLEPDLRAQRDAVGDVGGTRIDRAVGGQDGTTTASRNADDSSLGTAPRMERALMDGQEFRWKDPCGRGRFSLATPGRITLSGRGEQDQPSTPMPRFPWPLSRTTSTAARGSTTSRTPYSPRDRPTRRAVGSSPQGRRTHPEEVVAPPRSSVETRQSWSGSLGTFEYELSRLYDISCVEPRGEQSGTRLRGRTSTKRLFCKRSRGPRMKRYCCGRRGFLIVGTTRRFLDSE